MQPSRKASAGRREVSGKQGGPEISAHRTEEETGSGLCSAARLAGEESSAKKLQEIPPESTRFDILAEGAKISRKLPLRMH